MNALERSVMRVNKSKISRHIQTVDIVPNF